MARSLATAPMKSTPNHDWTKRWIPLRRHPEQLRLWYDKRRFKIIPAGRRSGKTELAKRWLIERLFPKERKSSPGRFFAAAPTRDQAKRIWWQDLNDLIKPDWKAVVSASELKIRTTRGAEDWVIGLDKPMRMEGVLGGCGSSIDVSADPRLFPDQRPTPMLCWFPSGAAPSKEI